MSHLSDGQLHGWLDGGASGSEEELIRQHLESCVECSARLEEARGLREAAAAVLAEAVPEGLAPAFDEIVRRADDTAPAVEVSTPASRTRKAWLSPERLGWAATVALALGAGWMARALLVEKGWTDPFHEGRAVVEEPTLESVPARGQLLDRTLEEAVAPGAAEPERQAAAGKVEAEKEQEPAEFREDADVMAGTEHDAAARSEPAEAAPEEAAAPAARALEAPRAPVDESTPSWHVPPSAAVSPRFPDIVGCYRLEFSWSPAAGYLPGTLRLSDEPAAGRRGGEVWTVSVPGGAVSKLRHAVWTRMISDSLWVQLVTEPEGETLTMRVARSDSGWVGEGRVLDPSGRAGENRGTVRLASIACPDR